MIKKINLFAEIWNRGWTQRDLSRETGIHASTLSLILNGRLTPSKGHVERISRALGQPAVKLFKD
jgi:transcriptional regulator with XRE-family HTH domain